MKQFVSWRRASMQKAELEAKELEAQKSIIDYFVQNEKGNLVADYTESDAGVYLSGCTELYKAITHVKTIKGTLIIAKSTQFNLLEEVLQILEDVGEDNIMFCDLPNTNKASLPLYFAMSERAALLISIRTKAGFKAKAERGETWVRNSNISPKATEASIVSRREKAKNNPNNKLFFEFITDYQKIHGRLTPNSKFEAVAAELNKRGKLTSTGLPFTSLRARNMFYNIRKLYSKE